jgi:Spy/CpxP family protein refolding chaperone
MNNKVLFLLICIILSSNFAYANNSENKKCAQTFVCTQNNMFDIKRETMYNALNLTDEQIIKYEDIKNENSSYYIQKCSELKKENKKLATLTKANASSTELNNQKKVIKNITKDIKNFQQKEDKEIKKFLTSKQKSKYTMIKKLERDDYKKASNQKDYYKNNPEMQKFGGK